MSNNKGVRKRLERIYGKGCMIERAGIRYIPVEHRKKIKGYKRSQEKITYHHIEEEQHGGKRTIENGALIKGYNHTWLHTLPEEEKQEVNRQLQQFKMNIVNLNGDGTIEKVGALELDFNFDKEDCITIPVYPTKKKKEKLDKRKSLHEKENKNIKKYKLDKFYTLENDPDYVSLEELEGDERDD